MNAYTRQLKQIQEAYALKGEAFSDYIHRQKLEISAAYQGFTPIFFVELDYYVYLTRSLLTQHRESISQEFVKEIDPFLKKYNNTIHDLSAKLSGKEFYYIGREVKLFYYIISHISNLLQKKQHYLIPSYVFIESIDRMLVLSPLLERTIDPRSLMRNKFNLLRLRFLLGPVNPQLAELVDYAVWFEVISSFANERDKKKFFDTFKKKISNFTDSPQVSKNSENYTTVDFVEDLRGIISTIEIKKALRALLEKDSNAKTTAGEFLQTVEGKLSSSLEQITQEQEISRCAAITASLTAQIASNLEENKLSELREYVITAKAMLPYLTDVFRHLIPASYAVTLRRFEETLSYIDELFPATAAKEAVVASLTEIRDAVSMLIDKPNLPSKDSVNLFVSKMRQLSAGR